MKKKIMVNTAITVAVLLVVAVTSCFVWDQIKKSQEREIISLKAKIVPMEFSLQQEDNYIVITYSFLDLAGNSIKTKTDKIRGNELFIDCIVKDFTTEAKVAFPVILYSNALSGSEGIVIAGDYDNNGFPEIFHGVTAKEKRKLTRLYADILKETSDQSAFRSSPHIMATNQKQYFELVSRIRGGLEIILKNNAPASKN